MKKIDYIDLQILDILKKDSRLSIRQISSISALAPATVHHRIKKLKERGIIKKYSIEIDYSKIGYTFEAIALLSVDYKALRNSGKNQHLLAKEILKFEEVEDVFIITGNYDLLLHIRCRDVKQYDNFLLNKLQKLSGIDRTYSMIVLEHKQ